MAWRTKRASRRYQGRPHRPMRPTWSSSTSTSSTARPSSTSFRAYCHDDDEAMDLAALTFERALVALRGPGLTGPPLPWLLRVTRNAAIDRHRRQGTRRRLLSALGHLPRATAPPARPRLSSGRTSGRSARGSPPCPTPSATRSPCATGPTSPSPTWRRSWARAGRDREADQPWTGPAEGDLR